MHDAQFENITEYGQLAEIAERYWDADIYPNRLFPRVAAVYPMLMIQKIPGARIAGTTHRKTVTHLSLMKAARSLDATNWGVRRNGEMFAPALAFS